MRQYQFAIKKADRRGGYLTFWRFENNSSTGFYKGEGFG
jgi:hypothetical protein